MLPCASCNVRLNFDMQSGRSCATIIHCEMRHAMLNATKAFRNERKRERLSDHLASNFMLSTDKDLLFAPFGEVDAPDVNNAKKDI